MFPTRRITLTITERDFELLQAVAAKECRDLRGQARMLLRQALEAEQSESASTETPPRPEREP